MPWHGLEEVRACYNTKTSDDLRAREAGHIILACPTVCPAYIPTSATVATSPFQGYSNVLRC